jgi:carboxypeptidase Q
MRIALIAALAIVTVGGAASMPVQEPVDEAMIARIRNEGLTRSQVAPTFSTFVDTIGPRLTASPEARRAAEFARDLMAKWGLSNSRLEAWDFGRGWTLDRQTIEMVAPRYMPLVGYAEAWSPSTTGEMVVPVRYLAGKSAEEVEAMATTLDGTAVLQQPLVSNFITTDRVQPTLAPDPPAIEEGRQGGRQTGTGRGRGRGGSGPTAAQRIARVIGEHATVLIKPSRGLHGTVFVQAASRETPGDRLPKIVLAGEHYNLIARLVEAGTPVELRVNVQTRFLDDRRAYNVLGEIPGTDPALADQVVMLGAHLDSWHAGTGATDNADGAAAVLEAFRILKAIDARPRRTLRVALWSGEEEGLLGSRAWVRDHLEGETHRADREKLDVYFNIDPGKGPIYGWYLEHNAAAKPIFDAWLAPFRDLGVVRNVPQGIGSTDHLSFINAGVPGFNPVQDYVDYDVRLHHTNADTAERIDVKDLQQNAVILASFVYHAAMRVEPIPSPARK